MGRRERERRRTCSFDTCVLPEMRECHDLRKSASCVHGRGLSGPFSFRFFFRVGEILYCIDG